MPQTVSPKLFQQFTFIFSPLPAHTFQHTKSHSYMNGKVFGFVVFCLRGFESEFWREDEKKKHQAKHTLLLRRLLLFASDEVVYYYAKLIHLTCLCICWSGLFKYTCNYPKYFFLSLIVFFHSTRMQTLFRSFCLFCLFKQRNEQISIELGRRIYGK